MAAKKKQISAPDDGAVNPFDLMDSFLDQKENKDYHFNSVEEIDYSISSGSLTLDIKMGGGVHPGILRLCGVTEGGKTSCALSFANNFLKQRKDGFVFYFKAEGRLSESMMARSGIDKSRFKIIRTNTYEVMANSIENQIKNNPDGFKYMFIIDSMDALNLKEDAAKKFGENQKVAGSAYLTSIFLKRMALPISCLGHIAVLISQVRAQPKIDQYEVMKGKNSGIVTSTGGHALLHYSDWILEFHERNKKDIITDGAEKDPELFGHWCKIQFKKTPNEKSRSEVKYPIKYGRTNGKSVWVEKEIADLLLAYGYLKKKGGWFSFPEAVIAKVDTEASIKLQSQIQGMENVSKYLEDNPDVTKYFFNELSSGLKEDV